MLNGKRSSDCCAPKEDTSAHSHLLKADARTSEVLESLRSGCGFEGKPYGLFHQERTHKGRLLRLGRGA